MQPEKIIGHEKQLLQLTQDLDTGNLAHGYLFSGPAHIGKTAVAHWFARQILARDVADGEKEQLLHAMDHLIHPDFLVLDMLWTEDKSNDWNEIAKSSNISQQHRSKAKMKTDIIGVDDVREIQQRLHETGDLPHRVCIIRSVDRMQESAANAFLKMLEEPPKGRIFLLTTEASALLLPTITSRVRQLRFERVADQKVQQLLIGLDEADAGFIAHIAQGAPGLAIRLKEDPDALREEKTLHGQAVGFWNASNNHERLKSLKALLERSKQSERLLFHLALALRESKTYARTDERALMELAGALKTNAYRPLQVQKFVFSLQ